MRTAPATGRGAARVACAVQGLAADARGGLPVAEVLGRATALLASPNVIPVIGAARDQDVIRRADGSVAPVPCRGAHVRRCSTRSSGWRGALARQSPRPETRSPDRRFDAVA